MILHLLSTGHYISPHFFRFSFICCIILQLSVSCASLVFIPRTSTLNTLCNNWCWSWSPNTLSTWCELPTHWKRPWCWKWLKAEEEEGNRGWDGWMASLTPWAWVWANSKRWWRTGKSGVLQSMGSQRVRHDWVTEQQEAYSLPIRHLGKVHNWISKHIDLCNLETQIRQGLGLPWWSF